MLRGPGSIGLASLALFAALEGCGHREREPAPADQLALAASPEPIAVRRGQRLVDVRCERACGAAQVELSRLQRGCVQDPSSNVHHVTERAPMIALGCCTEAASVFSEACGDEGSMGACIARWSRHCEHGELLERDEPPREEDPT